MGLFGRGMTDDQRELEEMRQRNAERELSEDEYYFQYGQFGERGEEAYFKKYGKTYNRVTGGQDEKYGDHDAKGKKGSSNLLKKGEEAGSKKEGEKKDGVAGAISGEKNIASAATNSFINKVGGKDDGTMQGRAKKKLMKRLMPVILSACGVGGFGVMSFFGQMSMPMSFISQIQGNFNSIGTSNTMRTTRMLKWQMDSENRLVRDCVKSRIFGADKFKISGRQRAKLANAGITVDDSGSFTVMKYTNAEGVEITIVPDSRQATGENTVDFKSYYNEDQKFRESYSKGARTWRGAVAAWFDNLANKFLNRLGVYRGVWSDFKKSAEGDQEANLEKMRTKISEEVGTGDNIKGGAKNTELSGEGDDIEAEDVTSTHGQSDVDLKAGDADIEPDGKIKIDTPETIAGGGGSSMSKKLYAFANGAAGKATGAASAVANLTCAALDVTGAIALVVAAYQTTQVLKTASTIFEAIQKGQVTDSNTTPIHEIANSLTMRSKRTYNYYDRNGDYQTETRTASAMEANAVGALYGNNKTNSNDASIRSFNITGSLGAIAKLLNIGLSSFKACTYAKMAASVVGAITDTISIVACAISFGIGCLIDAAIDAAVAAAASVGIAVIISTIVSVMMPQVVQVLTRKIATEVVGEDLGNALVSGGNIYMSQNHQYAGGSLSNKDGFTRYLAARDEVNEDKARVARETLSPFDISSPYTFMGSLMTKMIPVTVTASSISSSVSGLTNTFGKAVSGLLPGARAVTSAITAQEAADATEKYCPELDSIGAVGDAFCNPYIVTDVRTMESDPAQIVDDVDGLDDNFEDGEDKDVPTIKKDSSLSKYILYCGQRQSPFGMPDNNIAQEFQSGNTGSVVGDSLIGAIPIAGDVIGAMQQEQVLNNYGYVTGEACVIDNEKPPVNATYADWKENKKYQRFIEDQRLVENMGLVEKSAVTAFLDDYYAEHPIDNSYEGILARRSGLTKNQVVATLDAMEFIAWYQDYEPSDYSPYVPEVEEETQVAIEETPDYGSVAAILPKVFIEDRRQRNFAI